MGFFKDLEVMQRTHGNILKLYKPKNEIETRKSIEIQEEFEPVSIEGQTKLAVHMRYERDSNLIKKIKGTSF
ncbi:MAG: hypothetical protein LC115_11740 [Bacteroidia bacterium]|nr:hypothetical protein [Bacteroidia bacterium]